MRTLWVSMFVLGMLGAAIGCDSSGEGPTDAERFVDAWTLTEVTDNRGDQTAVFLAGFNSITVNFAANGPYTLVVDAIDNTADLTLSGPYTVNEPSKTVSLTVDIQGQSLVLPLGYSFSNDTTLLISGNSVLINPLFQTGLQGTVRLTFTAS